MNNFWKPVRSKAKPKSNSIKTNFKSIKPFINLKPFHKPQNNRDRALIRHNPWGDKDKDGVINLFDCKPLNKRQQGWVKGAGWRGTPQEKKEAYQKLRKAGINIQTARRVRGWRPTRVNQIINKERAENTIEKDRAKLTPPQSERDYRKHWRDSPKARESIARSRENDKEKRKVRDRLRRNQNNEKELVQRIKSLDKRHKEILVQPEEVEYEEAVQEPEEKSYAQDLVDKKEEDDFETAQEFIDDDD